MDNPFLNPDDYVIFDTETTGLRNPHPVEISIIDLTGKTLLNSRLKPPILIESDATAIHGISNQDVSQCLRFYDIYSEFQFVTRRKTLLIYNAAFDLKVISNAYSSSGLLKPKFKSECVMLAYSEFVGEWNDYFNSYKWQKLPSGDHTSLGDCLATLKVLHEIFD
jgi:DNA polymerase-3 subunit epsilon